MVEPTNVRELEDWLHRQPRKVGVAVATRALLRVFPLLQDDFSQSNINQNTLSAEIVLPIFRVMAMTWVFARYRVQKNFRGYATICSSTAREVAVVANSFFRSQTVVSIANSATYAAEAITEVNYASAAGRTGVALATRAAARGSSAAVARAVTRSVNYAVEAPGEKFLTTTSSEISAATTADISSAMEGSSPRALTEELLWQTAPPERLLIMWDQLRAMLNNCDENWESWTRWYDAVLNGENTPGGEELDIFRVTLNSEEDWKRGPAYVNALIKAKEGEITPHISNPEIPGELDGQSWESDRQTGMLTPVFRPSIHTKSEIADMEAQRPFLLECAQGLVAAIEASTSNSAKQLLPASERYRRSIEIDSSLISIPEVYAAGVRLRNSHDRIRREVENEGMPDVASNIGEAMDSVIGLHGPFILATARGREMNARARDDNRTKSQELAYKTKSLELSDALRQSYGLVTESGKNLIAEINNEIATGPHPERSTMLAEASNHNLLVTASSLIALEFSKVVLLDTAAGKLAIGVGTSTANIALNWMMANAALLISFAATSPETLYWLPHFLRWLNAKYELLRN